MSIFDYLRKKRAPSSAATAKERLQIIVAHERNRVIQRHLRTLLNPGRRIADDKIKILSQITQHRLNTLRRQGICC